MTEPTRAKLKWSPNEILFAGGAALFLFLAIVVSGGEKNEPAPVPTPSDLPAIKLSEADQHAAAATWATLLGKLVKRCDAATKGYAEVAGSVGAGASVYDGYNVSVAAKAACSGTGAAVKRMAVPDGLSTQLAAQVEATREDCANAYAGKWLAVDASIDMFDGDMRPSKVAEVRRYADAAAAGVVLCSVGLAGLKATPSGPAPSAK